jgi:hypothetical protein
MTPVEVAICKIWFDGAYLRLLVHVGSLRRELRLLGFEESTAMWLNGEISGAVQRLGVKGKVRDSSLFSVLGKEYGEVWREGC